MQLPLPRRKPPNRFNSLDIQRRSHQPLLLDGLSQSSEIISLEVRVVSCLRLVLLLSAKQLSALHLLTNRLTDFLYDEDVSTLAVVLLE
jgi:hypothetical protein